MGCGASKTPQLVGATPNTVREIRTDGPCGSTGHQIKKSSTGHQIKKSERIVILGAGPAGLHLASRLKQLGCTNVTILERTFRYGGKTHTVYEHGNPNDIGTCWMHPGYTPVLELIKKYNAGPVVEPFEDRENGNRNAVEADGTREAFTDWVLSEGEEVTLPKWMHSLMPDGLQKVSLAAAILKYSALHREIFGDYQYSLLPQPSEENMRRIAKPFLQFLKDESLREIEAVVFIMQTAQGYGFLEAVPAYYALSWITPTLLESFLKAGAPVGPGLADQHGFQMHVMMLLRQGFLTLWDKLVAAEGLAPHIQYGVHAQAIRRRGSGGANASMASPVEIDVKREQPKGEGPKPDRAAAVDGRAPAEFFSLYPSPSEVVQREASLGGELETISCDQLFVAAPFDVALPLLGDGATAMESEYVNALRPMTLVASLFTSSSVMELPVESMVEGSKLAGEGRLYSARHTRRVNDPALPPPADGREPYVGHQLYNRRLTPADTDGARDQMVKDLAHYGYKDVEVGKYCAFNTYMPHFDVDGICTKRYPWRLLEAQGTHNTCWVGSSACYESVLDVVNYNNLLLDRGYVRIVDAPPPHVKMAMAPRMELAM